MIYLQDLAIHFGERTLFSNLNLSIGLQDKIGLVGKNGSGKSTLLKIMTNELKPDQGHISAPSGLSIGYLRQTLDQSGKQSILHACLEAFPIWKSLKDEMSKLETALETVTSDDEAIVLSQQLHDSMEAWNHLQGYEKEIMAIKLLTGLGFRESELHHPINTLSGGWYMRVELAKLLLSNPDVLLLDEPTNHLDIDSIIWFEKYLLDYPGAVLLISHDQDFLANIISRTWEIENGKIEDYRVGYREYKTQKIERAEIREAAYRNQQKVIQQKEMIVEKFRAKASKAKFAQSLIKQLDRMDRIELDGFDDKTFKLAFDPAPRSGIWAIKGQKINKKFGKKEVLRNIDIQIERGERVAFVGQNGQGKSTLVKILVDALKPTSGAVEKGHNVKLAYYAQDQSDQLAGNKTVLQTLEEAAPESRRTQVRSVLGAFLFSGEDVDKKVSVLSGGERARLAMACLIMHPINLLILDEPTNHLDVYAKEVLKQALISYDGALVVVSHDREFLSGLTSKTYEFRNYRLHEYLGDVNYFLEKREAKNLREISKSNATEPTDKTQSTHKTLSFKERKDLNKKIAYLERDIEKIEIQIKELEQVMSNPDFYQQPDHPVKLDTYQKLKGELESLMEKWEKYSDKLSS